MSWEHNRFKYIGGGIRFKLSERLAVFSNVYLSNMQFYNLDLGIKYQNFKFGIPIKTAIFHTSRYFGAKFTALSFACSVLGIGYLAWAKDNEKEEYENVPINRQNLEEEIRIWNKKVYQKEKIEIANVKFNLKKRKVKKKQ